MATSTQNKKIEAIYPLTPIQQGFLFHHLTSSEDQGFLNVQCALQGPLHIMDFKKSWGSAVKRHAVLRTSIHWKKIKHPVLVVSPDKEVDWNYLDWSEFSKDQYGESLTALKKSHKETGVNFEKAPLAHIVLIKKGEDSYILLWSCHHLLIDGWSTSIILQDVFEFYHALRTNTTPNLGTIPTYDTYLNWLKKNKEPQAPDFWKKMFYGFKPKLFFKEPKTSTSGAYTSNVIAISENTSEDLKLLAKQSHLTMNSLLQGIWSVLLAKHSGVYDVCFGTTVSGRSALFPKIESITGMFVNVLPVRANFTKSTTFIAFLQQLQLEQQESRNYEHSTLEEIISWTALPATVKMFDNLFVFENFPWEDIDKGGVLVKDFQSGISTTYPATLVVKGGKFFKINLLVNSQVIPQQVSEWFLKNFQKASHLLTQETSLSVQDILEHLDAPHFNDNALLEPTEQNTSSTGHSKSLPRDEQELKLKTIWETVFEDGPIGIHDNFFELGGKSMLAIKLFSRIENNMGIKLPPTTLIEHPTIASLASILDVREEKKPWQNLVPIKPKGNKAPLFCVHAAGSHFFYYNHLRNYVNADRPVYVMQASGIENEIKLHASVKEMAADFVNEITRVQPNGPYHIMTYCFSTAAGMEIANLFRAREEEVHLIVVDTMAYAFLDTKMRFVRFIKRLGKNPINGMVLTLKNRLKLHVKPVFSEVMGSESQKKIERLRKNHLKIYKKYKWEAYHGPISLIIGKNTVDRIREEIVSSWEVLAKEKIRVIHTEGEHFTLFEEPTVKFTAASLEKSMQGFEANSKKT